MSTGKSIVVIEDNASVLQDVWLAAREAKGRRDSIILIGAHEDAHESRFDKLGARVQQEEQKERRAIGTLLRRAASCRELVEGLSELKARKGDKLVIADVNLETLAEGVKQYAPDGIAADVGACYAHMTCDSEITVVTFYSSEVISKKMKEVVTRYGAHPERVHAITADPAGGPKEIGRLVRDAFDYFFHNPLLNSAVTAMIGAVHRGELKRGRFARRIAEMKLPDGASEFLLSGFVKDPSHD